MLKLFTIHDGASGAYMRPFWSQSSAAAIRSFGDLVKDPEHPIGMHPEDYTLCEIGEFNEQTGEMVPIAPHSLGNGLSFPGSQQALNLEASGA